MTTGMNEGTSFTRCFATPLRISGSGAQIRPIPKNGSIASLECTESSIDSPNCVVTPRSSSLRVRRMLIV